ncbi:hypothetical protein CDAR_95191 [Caerostris darwini]|uniref:Uncharacterized protein n=1 Tax=Caerostris darwini TaxID=1538125 RepID=A0AAV4PK53_9ARAC|nr:hypothetical protein CDAR_95191 [Caerostris darwini]
MVGFACLGRHPRADRPPAQLPAGPAESQPDDSTVFHVRLHPRPVLLQLGLPRHGRITTVGCLMSLRENNELQTINTHPSRCVLYGRGNGI